MYLLGVDLGTTYTAAATNRSGRVEIANLGNRTPTVPSVLYLREDGSVVVGEAALRRAIDEPHRVVREFKRRVGDPTPIIVGGAPRSAELLMSEMLRWVVASVSDREGGVADWVAVTHPANWGLYKQDLLTQGIRAAGLERFSLLTEPQAAAVFYASQERVEPGTVVAVYDLGGGTFDVAVLRKGEMGFEILGSPEGLDRLGGIDFDEAVFQHVLRSLGGSLDELDPDDPAVVGAVSRLRHDCVEAKEVLSTDVDVVIPVILPGMQSQVRLTRPEFEAMIRPSLADSIEGMRRALRSAGVEPAALNRVLLVGGSSRIPLVAQMVGAALARPVAIDAHPKHAVALGAALALADLRRSSGKSSRSGSGPAPTPSARPVSSPAPFAPPGAPGAQPVRPVAPGSSSRPPVPTVAPLATHVGQRSAPSGPAPSGPAPSGPAPSGPVPVAPRPQPPPVVLPPSPHAPPAQQPAPPRPAQVSAPSGRVGPVPPPQVGPLAPPAPGSTGGRGGPLPTAGLPPELVPRDFITGQVPVPGPRPTVQPSIGVPSILPPRHHGGVGGSGGAGSSKGSGGSKKLVVVLVVIALLAALGALIFALAGGGGSEDSTRPLRAEPGRAAVVAARGGFDSELGAGSELGPSSRSPSIPAPWGSA